MGNVSRHEETHDIRKHGLRIWISVFMMIALVTTLSGCIDSSETRLDNLQLRFIYSQEESAHTNTFRCYPEPKGMIPIPLPDVLPAAQEEGVKTPDLVTG